MTDAACPAVDVPKVEIRIRTASDGYPLHYRHWRQSGTPRGWLLTLHGIQSHSGWYEYSGQTFAAAGWDVRIPDRRGSGLNTQLRGDVNHWKRLLHDVQHFLRDIQQEREQTGSNAPIMLAGISWGAKLALAQVQQSSSHVDGLTLITPGIFPKVGPSWRDRLRIRLARMLQILERRIPIPLSDPALFTAVPAQQNMIRKDPLALHEMTLSMLYASLDLDQQLRQPVEVNAPLLTMLAERDRIIDNQRTEQFVRNIARSSLEVHTYSGVEHTLELEACREEFVRDWLNWANSLPQRPEST